MNADTQPAAGDEREAVLSELAQQCGPRQTDAKTVRCRACGFAWDVGAPGHHAADCLHLRAKRVLATPQEAASGAVQVQEVALDAIPTSWELSFGSDDEEERGMWRVHNRNGSTNDREWTLIGTGATPTAAIRAAMKGPQ